MCFVAPSIIVKEKIEIYKKYLSHSLSRALTHTHSHEICAAEVNNDSSRWSNNKNNGFHGAIPMEYEHLMNKFSAGRSMCVCDCACMLVRSRLAWDGYMEMSEIASYNDQNKMQTQTLTRCARFSLSNGTTTCKPIIYKNNIITIYVVKSPLELFWHSVPVSTRRSNVCAVLWMRPECARSECTSQWDPFRV